MWMLLMDGKSFFFVLWLGLVCLIGVCFTDDMMVVVRDNEKPVRRVQVNAFQAQGRPISNEEVGIP